MVYTSEEGLEEVSSSTMWRKFSEELHVHQMTVRKLLRTGKLLDRKLAKR